ncbi:hypothetical protein [Natrinema caseinilyticum]|uniref:hypothetical protein n=1 Tax=Natrinema caseinilyticum TaxID=2961570 RepID=UPI0020C21606|nr:hypothetical protein [Natrinema caseinilyticum]
MNAGDARSVDGRVFKSIANDGDGDVDGETYFRFDQTSELIHARYRGGTVRLGHLVGHHLGDSLDFRYAHVTVDGDTATGHSVDRIEQLEDGRLRLHEEWTWESKSGSGSSVLEELTDDGDRPPWTGEAVNSESRHGT